ncbi:hypothetical protein BKA69DRAFT_1051224 [Paraphysoderma sedebokerense]|nr:hypothetical protein BKA69DRAFT_1051224 [Paraphysoderma sedebokerense]
MFVYGVASLFVFTVGGSGGRRWHLIDGGWLDAEIFSATYTAHPLYPSQIINFGIFYLRIALENNLRILLYLFYYFPHLLSATRNIFQMTLSTVGLRKNFNPYLQE